MGTNPKGYTDNNNIEQRGKLNLNIFNEICVRKTQKISLYKSFSFLQKKKPCYSTSVFVHIPKKTTIVICFRIALPQQKCKYLAK